MHELGLSFTSKLAAKSAAPVPAKAKAKAAAGLLGP